MSLPTLKRAHHKQTQKLQQQAAEAQKEAAVLREVSQELKIHNLDKQDALLAPDGSFRPKLRAVVQDALLDSRFDNVSTVLSDPRWFEKNEEVPGADAAAAAATGSSKGTGVVRAREDLHRAPLVSVLTFNKKAAAQARGLVKVSEDADPASAMDSSSASKVDSLTLQQIAHSGF
eukprot:gene75-86_t